jgi:cell wall-associated NlpC family hydrolase
MLQKIENALWRYIPDMNRLLTALVALAVLAAIPVVSLADATHVVRKGDTLGKIARAHHVSVAKIRAANALDGTRLPVGTTLVLPGGMADSKRRNARTGADSKGTTLRTGTWKPPTEAELAELARGAEKTVDTTLHPAFAASHGVAASPDVSIADESIKDRLLRVAQRMLAVPYRFGGTTLWGLDCSGFVQKAFAFLDLGLPRTAREQFREGLQVSKADLLAGDLVFFRTYAKYPSHVGIYLGDNRFIHASARDRKVTIDNLDEPYYMKHYIGAKRLLSEGDYTQN